MYLHRIQGCPPFFVTYDLHMTNKFNWNSPLKKRRKRWGPVQRGLPISSMGWNKPVLQPSFWHVLVGFPLPEHKTTKRRRIVYTMVEAECAKPAPKCIKNFMLMWMPLLEGVHKLHVCRSKLSGSNWCLLETCIHICIHMHIAIYTYNICICVYSVYTYSYIALCSTYVFGYAWGNPKQIFPRDSPNFPWGK